VEKNLILSAKIKPPLLKGNLLERERLHKLLDEGLDCKLILLSAPAGFGKTTLVVNWISGINIPFAWLSLDVHDNDAAVFFLYLLHALAEIIPDIDPSQFSLLYRHNQDGFRNITNYLLTKVESYGKEFLLILDDYHLIDNIDIHENMEYFLSNSPPNSHYLLAARADPPFKLSRLRSNKDIREIRADDLRFNLKESAFIINQPDSINLSESQLSQLNQRIEGWAAGLHLASISLQGKKDLPDVVKKFSGGEKYVIDYFLEEVLVGLPPDTRDFLLSTSILNRFSVELCDAVLEITNSSKHIHYLEKRNVFIFPLDDQQKWYRYHHLFRDLLRIHLDNRDIREKNELHKKAATWMLANGLEEYAVDHLIEAGEYAQAVNVIAEIADDLLKQSRFSTIERWVQKIPDEDIRHSPDLRLRLLWTRMIREYDHTEIGVALEEFEREGIQKGGKIDAFRAFLSLSEGEFSQSGKYAESALRLVEDKRDYFYQTALWCAGVARAIEMDLDSAAELLQELQVISQNSDNKMFAVMSACHLATIFHRQGQLKKAEEKYFQALKIAEDRSNNVLPIGGEALMGLGDLYREQNDLEKAADYLLDGIEQTFLWRDVAAMDGYMALARVRQAENNYPEAYHALDKAFELAEKYDVIDYDDKMVNALRARLQFAQGRMGEVRKWANETGYDDLDPDKASTDPAFSNLLLSRELQFYSRYLIEIGEIQSAMQWINVQLEKFNKINKVDVLIELNLYLALTHHLLGQKSSVIADLNRVVQLAQNTGFKRLFYDLGPEIMQILRTYKKLLRQTRFLDTLLDGFSAPVPSLTEESLQMTEPLSDREIDVLKYLRTNLTTPEIAEEMMIGVNTVRTHIKNIYQKLGVHKRSAAVRVARSNSFIPGM
jgi:LuxR family maltose regulon positive regulatory protein